MHILIHVSVYLFVCFNTLGLVFIYFLILYQPQSNKLCKLFMFTIIYVWFIQSETNTTVNVWNKNQIKMKSK